MANVGYATLQVIPSMRGIDAKLTQGLAGPMRAAGEKSGTHLATGLGTSVRRSGRSIGGTLASHVGLGFAALGVGALVKSSVTLEASFSKTLSQIAVATGAPKSAIKGLHDEALKMGAQTVFSANEAAGAMLELGKSGISTRDIMGGGLKGTLTLAAAGSLDLGTAATIASNAMNTFALHGKDMGKIAAALAGGANASTASVESLGQALSQVGPGAKNAGLSLQETVGTLAAFDQAGIKGSDAGTSLKTMLQKLIPSTSKAKTAMSDLGLSFVDSKGNIDDITTIAQKLQDKLKGLSQEQRNSALQTIFGSDATRAATVLMNDGAKGLEKFITATKDQSAAQKMAKANMSGTAGALERLKGAAETAKLVLGEALAPVVRNLANYLSTTAIPKVSKFIAQIRDGKGAGGEFAHNLGLVFNAAKGIAGRIGDVVGALNGMPDWAKKLLATGVIGGTLAVKLKLPSLISGGAGLLGKSIGVQKVFVVNPGFGAPGGEPGLPGTKGTPGGTPAKGPGKFAAGASLFVEVAALAALAKGSADVTDSFVRWKNAGDNLDPTLAGIQKQLQDSNVGKYATDFHVNIPKLAQDIQLFGDKGSYFKKVMDRLQGDTGLKAFGNALLGDAIPGFTSHVEKADNATSDLLKITGAFAKQQPGAKTVVSLKQMKSVADALGLPLKTVRKELQALGKTNVKAEIGANSKPLEGRYRQSKALLLDLGHAHPMSTLDANGKPAHSAITAELRTLGIFGKQHPKATLGVDTSGVTAGVAYARNALASLHDKTIKVNIEQTGGAHRHAAGGYINGPGTATSDSIPAMLSNGEFVVNAAATKRHLALLHSINAQRFATGGQVGGPSAAGDATVLHLYDVDGRLMGTMRATARQELSDSASFDRAMAGRRA